MSSMFRDKITVNGVEFNTLASIFAYPGALRLGIDRIEGWRGTAEVDVIMTKIGFADGEIAASRFSSRARYMTLEGYVQAQGRDFTEDILNDLIWDAFPYNQDIELVRYEPVPKKITVRVAGAIENPQPTDDGYRFLVPLVAPDPHKYALTDLPANPIGISGMSGGGVNFPINFPVSYGTEETGQSNVMVLSNEGNAYAPFVATLIGPIEQGWRIENTVNGDFVAFSVSLNTGDTLVIDTKEETALLNGYSVDGRLVGDFFRLPPRGNAIRLFGQYNPTAQLTISAQSTWRN